MRSQGKEADYYSQQSLNPQPISAAGYRCPKGDWSGWKQLVLPVPNITDQYGILDELTLEMITYVLSKCFRKDSLLSFYLLHAMAIKKVIPGR
jgi:hypothetical protein